MALRAPLIALFAAIIAIPATWAQTPDQTSSADSAIAQAREFIKHHKYKEAEKVLKSALKQNHDNCRDCFLYLASTYWAMGEDKNTFKSLDRAFSLSPSNEQKADVRIIKGNMLLAFHDNDKLKQAKEEYRGALRLNPDDANAHYGLGVVALRESHDDEGKRELETYLKLEPQGAEAAYAKSYLENPRRARERFAPDFAATGLHGENIALKDYKGKIIVVDFWATWCPPCVASVDDLKRFVKKYPADKVTLISISEDETEVPWRAFIEKRQMTWLQVFDRDRKLSNDFNVHAFPTYLLIDGEGVIREQIVGSDSWKSVADRLKSKLDALTKGS